MDGPVFSPTDFVAVFNQTLELSYPIVAIEGELSDFSISKNRWLYFSLKDQDASVKFFGSVYQLPGPLSDGLSVRAVGSPRLHPRFGFSISLHSIAPIGEGSIKKAADLLQKKLAAEGLFDVDRKRALPYAPDRVGLITAEKSAAAADFIKIMAERWGGSRIELADVYVQGDRAPLQLVEAISYFNQSSRPPEVLVITRGGGSGEDLAAFNDERVVRAVAASRIPTLVAVGHETDLSLAELAADMRASTPSNAAQLLMPDKHQELVNLQGTRAVLRRQLIGAYSNRRLMLSNHKDVVTNTVTNLLSAERQRLSSLRQLAMVYDPLNALKRGYGLVRAAGKPVKSIGQIAKGDELTIELHDGTIESKATGVKEK